MVGQHVQGKPDKGGVYLFCAEIIVKKFQNDLLKLLQKNVSGGIGYKCVHLLMIGKGRAWRVSLVATWDWWVPVCWARHVTYHENVLGSVV